MKETASGIRYKRVDFVDPSWNDYETLVAHCHLNNYGCIFVDEDDCPIENEFDLEDIVAERNGHIAKKIEVIVLAPEDECECGNTIHGQGFFSCDTEGNSVEADKEKDWFGLYKCRKCGQFIIFQSKTIEPE